VKIRQPSFFRTGVPSGSGSVVWQNSLKKSKNKFGLYCVLNYICTHKPINNTSMNKETKKISQKELIEILNTIENPTFTHIVSETIVRMNKGKTKEGNKEENPYHNKVTKLRKGRFLIGSEYEKRVQGNDTKEGGEGTFKSQESKVGVHISKCVLFNEKYNKYYLSHERFPEVKPKSEFIFEGNTIDKILFDKWISDSNNYENQPQERKVEWTTLTIENIKEISLEGTKYIIEE
jgi:hypothetical protein